MGKEGLLVLFIVLLVLLVLVVLFAVLYKPVKHKMLRDKTMEVYGKRVYAIARDNDYLLINNFDYRFADGTKFHIDHILFAEKYIYVIEDVYVDGAVSAIESDNDWIKYSKVDKKDTQVFINNPLKQTKRLAKLFGQATMFDSSFIMSITLLNDDCVVRNFVQTSKDNFLSTPKTLVKLVKEIESSDIRPINQKKLVAAVHDIATKLNANYKPE
ncbi:MAG: NERD domain-containing protein [Bacilli bacterium]|nr:NERD domain-containing protein [Bacilli bacterium]